mmetsp:Transcript_20235/g.77477  ORF Transcript_20235/g.77477 Transcript_20235/m.77477 type:complete len:204 (+) Transcript_20235:605-1216(+)
MDALELLAALFLGQSGELGLLPLHLLRVLQLEACLLQLVHHLGVQALLHVLHVDAVEQLLARLVLVLRLAQLHQQLVVALVLQLHVVVEPIQLEDAVGLEEEGLDGEQFADAVSAEELCFLAVGACAVADDLRKVHVRGSAADGVPVAGVLAGVLRLRRHLRLPLLHQGSAEGSEDASGEAALEGSATPLLRLLLRVHLRVLR